MLNISCTTTFLWPRRTTLAIMEMLANSTSPTGSMPNSAVDVLTTVVSMGCSRSTSASNSISALSGTTRKLVILVTRLNTRTISEVTGLRLRASLAMQAA